MNQESDNKQWNLVPCTQKMNPDHWKTKDILFQFQQCFFLKNEKKYFSRQALLPRALQKQDLENISKDAKEWTVAEKSDGCRFWLFFSIHLSLNPKKETKHYFAVLIDRAHSIYPVHVCAPAWLFENGGSLFDGELVWSLFFLKNRKKITRQTYFVFDTIQQSGISFLFKSRKERYEVIRQRFHLDPCSCLAVTAEPQPKQKLYQDILESPMDWLHSAKAYALHSDKIVSLGNEQGLCFKLKIFYPLYQLDVVIRQLPLLSHLNDGLVFVPGGSLQDRVLKWKQIHTVDVALSSENKNKMWYYDHNQTHVSLDRCFEDLECVFEPTDKFLSLNALKAKQFLIIIECVLSVQPETEKERQKKKTIVFRPFRVRTDKSTANGLRAIQDAIQLVVNPISLSSFATELACFNSSS